MRSALHRPEGVARPAGTSSAAGSEPTATRRFCWCVLLETQGQGGAGLRRASSEILEIASEWATADHRIPPFIKSDPLRQQLGTQAVGNAGDRVETKAAGHLLT